MTDTANSAKIGKLDRREAIAIARARVAADKKRKVTTDPRIVAISKLKAS